MGVATRMAVYYWVSVKYFHYSVQSLICNLSNYTNLASNAKSCFGTGLEDLIVLKEKPETSS